MTRDTIFRIASMTKPMCGYYSVHTSEHALALGEAGIGKVASALQAKQGVVASLGGAI